MAPADTCDLFLRAKVVQLGHLARRSTPKVNTGSKTDGEGVLGRPVNQVQVVVVLQGRGIQNFERCLANIPLLPVGIRENVIFLKLLEKHLRAIKQIAFCGLRQLIFLASIIEHLVRIGLKRVEEGGV